MKKIAFSLLTAILPFMGAFAALPPLAQSSREIQAMLGDSHMQEYLGSAEMVQNIIRTEGGFAIMTQHYLMRVDVEYKSLGGGFVGPAAFDLHFYPPVDLLTGQVVN